jgi:hypothetical protein
MKQREHEALDSFTTLRKLLISHGPGGPRQRAKLPKRANEATCVLAFFAIAARERISEKNPHFSAHFGHNGLVPPI